MWKKFKVWRAKRKIQRTVKRLKKDFELIEAVMISAGFDRQMKRGVRRDIMKGNYSIFKEEE